MCGAGAGGQWRGAARRPALLCCGSQGQARARRRARGHDVRRGGAELGSASGGRKWGGSWWPGARRRAARAREMREGEGKIKEKREKEKKEKGEKKNRGKRKGGGRVGGIRGDGRERGVEHAARHVGRGIEKGWRLILDVRRRNVRKRFGRLGARTVKDLGTI
jgi:hypothetical protein